MKHSIRYRFTLAFVGMMTLMLFAMWAVNNFWLEDFYINQKVKALEAAYTSLDNVIQEKRAAGENVVDILAEEAAMQRENDKQMNWGGGEHMMPGPPPYFAGPDEDASQDRESESDASAKAGADEGTEDETESGKQPELLPAIRQMAEINNMTIVLVDSDTGNAVLSSNRDSEWLAMKVQRYTLGHTGGDARVLSVHENYTIERSYDPRSKSYYLESWGFFSDDQTLYIMSMPLASIRDSVDLSNRFMTYVGLTILAIGSVLMYITTRKVTSPILQLSALSEKMSDLDFDAKYEGDAEDELGVLGRSMNTLSDKLRETIGELKTANNELQADIEQKIQIDEMRKDFIANVSHELKTPIALIQGYAEGLTEGMADEAESRAYYCEVIMDEANKMNKMVKQLLNLTALEFGNDVPNMERFDVTDLIHQLVTSADILFQQKEANVILELPETCFVWADEFKIEEVLTNYLNNAMNHLDGERVIRIRAEQKDGEARIAVYNTGKAIPEEDLANLWTKFYKVDKARTREYGGSGIGLSIVKAIIDAHNKECGVRNTEDGVEFWFTLDSGEVQKRGESGDCIDG